MTDTIDFSSKSVSELVDIRDNLETQLIKARAELEMVNRKVTLDAIHDKIRRAEIACGERLRMAFYNAHEDTKTYSPPPSTVFAGWRDSRYSRYRTQLLLFAAHNAGVKLVDKLNARENKPLLGHWYDVDEKYIDRAAKQPVSVAWLEEAETCWSEYHHWLKTCPMDEHPMRLTLERRNTTGWTWEEEAEDGTQPNCRCGADSCDCDTTF